MDKKLAIFVIMIIMTASVCGQSDISRSKPTHQIGIDVAGVLYQVRDDIIAPLRWDGISGGVNLSYSVIGDKGRHNLEIRGIFGPLSNRYDHEGIVAEAFLGYSYMKRIPGFQSYGQLHLGSLIDWSYNIQMYDTWDDSHLYWLNVYELSPALRWSNTLGESHLLAVNFNFSLLALVSRPSIYRYYDQERTREFLSKPHEEMELTSLHEYIAIGFRGEYMYPVSKKLKLGVSYFLNYKTFSGPERISIFTNALQLKLLYEFGNNKKEKS